MLIHRRTSVAAVAAVAAVTASLVTGGAIPAADATAGPIEARASSSGTLVFIKDNNVWLSNGDGSNARAVTADGTTTSPYASPSQSDGGVIAAGRLDEIVRLDQAGRVLNRMNPAPLPSSISGHPIDGNLQEVAISPDGSLIAYTMAKYLSPPGADSGYRYATGYTAAGSFTDSGGRGTTFFEDPSWIGNSRTLQGGGFDSQVMIDDLNPNDPVHWFDDRDLVGDLWSTDLGNSELSPNGRYVMAIRGYDESTAVAWYRVNGDARTENPPPLPVQVCEIPGAFSTDPTWAPDSDSVAWSTPSGIMVRSGVEDCAAPSQLLVAGGSQPDWSPAPLNPPKGIPSGPNGPNGPNGPDHGSKITNVKRPKISGKAVVGHVLKASAGKWAPTAVKVRFTWKRNGRTIKAAHAKRYKVTRKDRGKRIAVVVTARRTGLERCVATSKAVRVRR